VTAWGGERDLLQAGGVNIVDMRQLDEFGASVPMRLTIEEARRRNGLIHVSLDVDFLDPQLAPGAGTTVPGGATFREAHLVMEMLHDCGMVGSLDVVELNPFLDECGRSARACSAARSSNARHQSTCFQTLPAHDARRDLGLSVTIRPLYRSC
jgi:arginase family enzyme